MSHRMHPQMTPDADMPKKSANGDMAIYLTQDQLAKRWQISPRTLERQRWIGAGPPYYKLNNLVRYLSTDIIEYERACQVTPPAAASPEKNGDGE